MIRDTDIDAIPDRAFVGQFVYELVRRDNDGYVDGVAASYEYTELPNSFDPLQSFVDQISVQTYAYAHRPVFPPNNTTEGKFECADIYIAKCGDGVVDDGRTDPTLGVNTPIAGETCDDGDQVDNPCPGWSKDKKDDGVTRKFERTMKQQFNTPTYYNKYSTSF